MNLSSYFQGLIAGWLRGVNFPAVPSSIQIGLSVSDPLHDGSGIVEPPISAGYTRKQITFGPVVTPDGIDSSISNSAQVIFGPVTSAPWSHLLYVFLTDGTHILASGPLNTARSLPVGDTFALDIGAVQLRLGQRFSHYLSDVILNWVRGVAAPGAPTALKLALSASDPKPDLSGLTEITTADGYQRQTIAFSVPIFVPNTGTVMELSSPVIFGPAVLHNWPQITHGAILDQSGNLILFGALASPRTVAIGDALPVPTPTIKLLVR